MRRSKRAVRAQIIAAVFTVAGGAGIFVTDIKASVFFGLLAVVSFGYGLWFSVHDELEGVEEKLTGTRESLETRLKDSSDLILGTMAGLTRKPPDTRLFGTEYLRTADTLIGASEGVEFVQHCWMLKKAARELNQYRQEFKTIDEEYIRIALLADIVKAAQRRIWAYSYTDKEHLENFWNCDHDSNIDEYFDAHRIASKNADIELRRVFVIPDLLHEDRDSYKILINCAKRFLHDCKMTDCRYALESEARAYCKKHDVRFPERSFFLADDCFISEGKLSRVRSEGYGLFLKNNEDAISRLRPFKEQFTILRNVAKPVTSRAIEELEQ